MIRVSAFLFLIISPRKFKRSRQRVFAEGLTEKHIISPIVSSGRSLEFEAQSLPSQGTRGQCIKLSRATMPQSSIWRPRFLRLDGVL